MSLKRTHTQAFSEEEMAELVETARESNKLIKADWIRRVCGTSCMGKKLFNAILSHGHYEADTRFHGTLKFVPAKGVQECLQWNSNIWFESSNHIPVDFLDGPTPCVAESQELNAVERQLEVQKLMQQNILAHAPAYPRCKCVKCLWYKGLSFVPYSKQRKAMPDASLLTCKQR